ncbi:MAG: hypothetical protein E7258_01655 [Lachnospiraceae bacterium]|nr:hypothetical protein [Lachnospiraceae bacterium]
MDDTDKKNKIKKKIVKILVVILVVVLLNILFLLRIGIIRIPEEYWINYFKNNKERFEEVVIYLEENSDNHSFKVSYLEPKRIIETGNKNILHLLFFAGFKRISDETDYKYTTGSYSDCLKVKFYISNLRIEDNDLMAIVYSEEEILIDFDEGDNMIHYEKIDDNWYLQYK